MASISLIDDDFAIEALVDCLKSRGHQVSRYSMASDAIASAAEIVKSDAVVLDVMMARPATLPESACHGGYRTGFVLAQRLRELRGDLPLLILSAVNDSTIAEWASRPKTICLNKAMGRSVNDIAMRIEQLIGQVEVQGAHPRAFIVHGHDEVAKLQVKNYLQNVLRFPEPIILHEQPSLGRTILEKLEDNMSVADIAFVILTPDDRVSSPQNSNEEKRRARQNVILELGYFLALLGRRSGRVILLHKGELELPSDISGLIYIDISHGVEAAGESIRREVQDVIAK